jgi:LCP family protein required for cell wall assembly
VRARRILLIVSILLVVCLVGTFLWVRSMFNGIERVDTEGQLASASSGTNYLIVGSDSREVVEGEQAGVNDGDFPGGQRADTMMLLNINGGETKMLSIPRDLWVTRADNGEEGKINGSYNGGAPSLIKTIHDSLGIPIDRYIEVDFVSFAGLVDSLGGITVNIPHPATDANSGLNITTSGEVELDGEQALAYVRSRHYVEHIDGQQVPEGTGDLGRIVRQQQFLTAVFTKLSDTKNPISLLRAFDKTSEGLRIDDEMGLFDAMRLGWRLRGGLDPSPETLPVTQDRIGETSVLLLDEAAAEPVLEQFR